MSFYLSLSIEDSATPVLRRAMTRLVNKTPLNAAMATAVQMDVKDNFIEKNAQGNKLGGSSTGYYAKAASTTSVAATSQQGIVRIDTVGIRLHYLGGTVVPVNKKWLTIPARAEAHGRTVSQVFPGFSGCVWLFNRARQPYAIASKSDGLVYFWLAKKAVIKPDPTVLPSLEKLSATAVRAAQTHIDREVLA